MIREVQVSFTNGAISGAVRNRLDNPIYKNSAEQIVNCRLLPQGGVTRRPGLALAYEMPVGPAFQVEEFVFTSEQAYVCIFSGGRVDIFDKNRRQWLCQVTGAPWTADQVDSEEIQCTQQLDTMIICHKDFPTQLLKRTAYAAFSLLPLLWDQDVHGSPLQPYHKYAPSNSMMTVDSFGPGTVNVYIDTPYFTAAMVGYWIRYQAIPMIITAYIDPQHVTANSTGALPGSPPAAPVSMGPDPEWDEQAFSPLHGYAQCSCFHEQRLAFGGGRDVPNALWLSQSVGPFNMDLGTGMDDEAIKYMISSDRVVEIKAMTSQLNLQIFAGHAEFVVPWFGNVALTPANFAVKKQSGYGIKSVFARPFDQSTLFISRTANAIREFSPQVTSLTESYAADSVSYMAMDLITDPVDFDAQMEGVAAQEASAYVINSSGTVAVLTRVKKENIGGWGQWDTLGQFRRCGVIDHEAWFIVRRWIAGVARDFVEILDSGRMLDCSSVWQGTATSRPGPFSGYSGELVHCLWHGVYFGELPIDGDGHITLPVAVDELEVGFNFVPSVVPLVTEVQLPDGISKGLPRRVVRTSCDFLSTGSAKVGRRTLYTDRAWDDLSAATPLHTGPFETFHLGWNAQAKVVVQGPLPLPFTLRSLMQEVEV